MIHTIRTVAVGDQESKIDSPIILYRGDREVEVEFTINGSKFTFTNGGNVIKSTNATHGQLVINTPTGENMFSEVTECHDGKVVFVITKEMIDELIEVGLYSFQIRLFDESQVSRVTIPPVLKGIDIRNPIAAEDETNVVDIALVDYAVVVKDEFEDLSTFLPDGNYNKTEWETKDVISGAKLNKIEDALYNINYVMATSDLSILNRLEKSIQNTNEKINENIDYVEEDIKNLEKNVNSTIESSFSDLKTELHDVNYQIDSIDYRLGAVENTVYNSPVQLTDYEFKKNNDDWTPVFNYLIDQGYRHIIIPKGEYRFASPANLVDGLRVCGHFGEGYTLADRTVIMPSSTAFRFTSDTSLQQHQNINIENIMFVGGTSVLDLGLCHCVTVLNCSFIDFTKNGIILTRGERHVFKNISFWARQKDFYCAFAFADRNLSTHSSIKDMNFGVDGEWVDRLIIENCTTMYGPNNGYYYSIIGGNILSNASIHNIYCHGGRKGVLNVNRIQQCDFRSWVMDGWTDADDLIHIDSAYDSNISSVSPGFAGNNVYKTGMYIGYANGLVIQSCSSVGDNINVYGFKTGGGVNQNITFIGCRGAYFSLAANDLIKNQITHVGCSYTHSNTSSTSVFTPNGQNEIHTLMNDVNGANKSTGVIRYQYSSGKGNRGILFEIKEDQLRIGTYGMLIVTGNGNPNGNISAPLGSIYLNKDGGSNTTLYVKESGGGGNTGWVAK